MGQPQVTKGQPTENSENYKQHGGLAHFNMSMWTNGGVMGNMQHRTGWAPDLQNTDFLPAQSPVHPQGVCWTEAVLRHYALVGFLSDYTIWVRSSATKIQTRDFNRVGMFHARPVYYENDKKKSQQ